MTARFAIIALLPQDPIDPSRADFISREFETPEQVATLIAELEERLPNWRAVTICHVEDLPLLMELRSPPEPS